MAEHIEREAVYNTLKAMYCDECTDEKCQMCEYAQIMFVLDNLPIADVQPVRRGRWEKTKSVIMYCSVCKNEAYWDTDYGQQLFDYCPYCGADMREPETTKG